MTTNPNLRRAQAGRAFVGGGPSRGAGSDAKSVVRETQANAVVEWRTGRHFVLDSPTRPAILRDA